MGTRQISTPTWFFLNDEEAGQLGVLEHQLDGSSTATGESRQPFSGVLDLSLQTTELAILLASRKIKAPDPERPLHTGMDQPE